LVVVVGPSSPLTCRTHFQPEICVGDDFLTKETVPRQRRTLTTFRGGVRERVREQSILERFSPKMALFVVLMFV